MLSLLLSFAATLLTIVGVIWCYRKLDPADPARRVAGEVVFKAKKVAVAVAIVLVCLVTIGIPHIRTNALFGGPLRNFGPDFSQTEGLYVGPAGWMSIDEDTYANGLPIIAYVSLFDTADFKDWTRFPTVGLLPERLRDGKGASWSKKPLTTSMTGKLTEAASANHQPAEPHAEAPDSTAVHAVSPVIVPGSQRGGIAIQEPAGTGERRGIFDKKSKATSRRNRTPRYLYFSPSPQGSHNHERP